MIIALKINKVYMYILYTNSGIIHMNNATYKTRNGVCVHVYVVCIMHVLVCDMSFFLFFLFLRVASFKSS